ncbi:MAG: hypothetical protein R3C14_07530 [Caldilineaceae bacterium]
MNSRRATLHSWSIIGTPSPGTVTALAFSADEGSRVFAGARTGIYCTDQLDRSVQDDWRRMPAAPLEIIALAVSPTYAMDATLLAGTGQGLFISRDSGQGWQAISTPMPAPVVLCLAFSSNYAMDGIIVAGTLEDGIYYSDSRGERWSYRSFGLLDAAVYALAISPNFAQDETIFAGTETALYYSYNGARAWKELAFPAEAAPIVSLALSPRFVQDQTVYAGTERHGLYRSTDGGQSWQSDALPAASINALGAAPAGRLLAATNAGLYAVDDAGNGWRCLLDRAGAFSLAVSDDYVITGLVNEGAWISEGRSNWRPCFTLPVRPLTGLVLSPHFDCDETGFLYGPQEGIWRTVDGGQTWACLNEGLPTLDIRSLALSPHFSQDHTVVAATEGGLLVSEDAGDHWSLATDASTTHVAFTPSGKSIAIATSDGTIQLAANWRGPWQSIPIPWRRRSQVLALALADNGLFRVAVWDPTDAVVQIWEGKPGHFVERVTTPASPTSVVNFWAPPGDAPVQNWYASIDQQLWEFQVAPGQASARAHPVWDIENGAKILSLVGSQSTAGLTLFACTGQILYQSTATNDWRALHDFGHERAVTLALSPAYPGDITVYALLLGGSFWRGLLP